MDFKLMLYQIEEKQKHDKEIETTPSMNLLDTKTVNEVKEILSTFSNGVNNQITDKEKACLLEARDQIQKRLRQQVLMCKVIPIGEINQYLSFRYDIGNFMLRKADLDEIINQNYCKNIIDTLYNCLRLDYGCKSPFLSCNRMAIVELAIDNFACRVPLDYTNYKTFEDKKIEIDSSDPYTGIGWTKSCNGIPEFYVTIANKEKVYTDEKGKQFTVGLGRFPLMAFNTTICVADRESNSLVKIAWYCNETLEDGSQVYDKFVQCSDNKTKEIREKIIKEEEIII
jgi:hypothetical protein